jgi:uncharacterized membrane protein
MDTVTPRSTAKIAGHPIHPMLVMFPVVLLIGVLVFDILFAATGNYYWTTFGLVALALGIVTALLAAVFGLIDYLGDRRVRALRSANRHLIANLIVVGLAIANLLMRYTGGPEWVLDWGVILSAATVVLLGYSGWKGSTLVYKHGVGVDSGRIDRQGA